MNRILLAAAVMILIVSSGSAQAEREGERWRPKARSGWVNAIWDGSRTTGNWVATTELLPGRSARVRLDGEAQPIEVRFFYENLTELEGFAYLSQGVATEFGLVARTPVRLHIDVVDPGSGIVWGEDDIVEYQDVRTVLPKELWNDTGQPVVEARRSESGELVNRIRLGVFRSPQVFSLGNGQRDESHKPFIHHRTPGGVDGKDGPRNAEGKKVDPASDEARQEPSAHRVAQRTQPLAPADMPEHR